MVDLIRVGTYTEKKSKEILIFPKIECCRADKKIGLLIFKNKLFQKSTIVVIRKRGKNRKRSLNLRINLDSTSEE